MTTDEAARLADLPGERLRIELDHGVISAQVHRGFASERWHLDCDRDSTLADQLAGLVLTLPSSLAVWD